MNKRQKQDSLGFNFNTKSMRIKIPQEKLNKIIQCSRQAMKSTIIRSCHWVASLIGKMTSVIPATGEALLHVQHLERDLTKSLRLNGKKNWEGPCSLSKSSLQDLQWCENWSMNKNGLPIHMISPEILTPALTIFDIGQRKKKSNKCKGTEDDLLCFKASRTKCQKLDNTAVLRQPNCPKIRDEGRRNSIVPTPDTCTTNLGTNEQLQSDCPVLPHSRSREHQGRSAQPEETPKEMVQDNQALLGKTNDRRFCYPTELPSENILELIGRRRDYTSTLTFQETSPRSSTGDTIVDNTVLVSYDLTDDTPTANCDENEQPLDISRLEAIKQGHSYFIQQLKVYRAVIASVFRVLCPHMPPIASSVIIQDFFQAKLKTVVKLPQQAQLETWDLSILTNCIAANFHNNTSLTIDKLQQKTVLLLCIATIWRSRSDIGTLQARDVHFKFDKDANLTGATLFIRAPKEAQQKHLALGALSEKSMCPVSTLFTFMEKTEHLRSELPVDHTVFLAYINNPSKVRSIQPSTVANIVKQTMKEAGIDTQRQAQKLNLHINR
ncbi:hypothetical protein BCV71DRAFT_260346 [Rhizopus microsporus]|uniref:Uncharacterized protein n=1 Tax=Rhizopus microsporus TaxID=58291 RepID=A0A1X0SDG9_RHIZD|nr:hypothetical protein BCV71DRAFT_260346 [Rhizopus microsporus]